jgi:hypothetical protein
MKDSPGLTYSILVWMVASSCMLPLASVAGNEPGIEVPGGLIHLTNPSMQMDIEQRADIL